jgi:hypothetical protein
MLDKADEESTTETLGESVAVNRRYKVTVLEQVREIVGKHIGGSLARDDWDFGLGEINAPSLKLKPSDHIPSEAMQRNHQWRIQIISSSSKERIGHFVLYAYTGEVCQELSSDTNTIIRRIDIIRKEGYLQPIVEKSDKHRSKMRKSALSNMIIKGDSRKLSKNIKPEEIDLNFHLTSILRR